MHAQLGLDFGTTNTVAALRQGERTQFLHINTPAALAATIDDIYRSILFFDETEDKHGQKLQSWAGPAALAEYLNYGASGRLLQSLKSHLASPHFTHTQIFGQSFSLENLVARFIRHLRADFAAAGFTLPDNIHLVAGRPVRFVGQEASAELAIHRLGQAYTQAGFSKIHFTEEPVAAAYAFATRLSQSRTILIADLGGGTSDFSVLRVVRPGPQPEIKVLAMSGVGLAGDDVDALLIKHLIAPQFGQEKILKNGLPPPRWLYDNLSRWHYLSFLRTPKNMQLLTQLIEQAPDPLPFMRFHTLVAQNGGFALAQAIQNCKRDLSAAQQAELVFTFADFTIKATLDRGTFESWLTPLQSALTLATNQALADAGLVNADIDHVFMTGGTSYIPAIRQSFATRFGADRLAHGQELTSVAAGLALVEN